MYSIHHFSIFGKVREVFHKVNERTGHKYSVVSMQRGKAYTWLCNGHVPLEHGDHIVVNFKDSNGYKWADNGSLRKIKEMEKVEWKWK
jgi:hypothetical protein